MYKKAKRKTESIEPELFEFFAFKIPFTKTKAKGKVENTNALPPKVNAVAIN
ncbi:hypothetical protein B6658_000300 [Campylobacter coli]